MELSATLDLGGMHAKPNIPLLYKGAGSNNQEVKLSKDMNFRKSYRKSI